MKLGFILTLACTSAIFLAAASASRAYVTTSNWLWVLLSLSLYVVGNLVMLRLMREGGLGLAISISSIAQLVLVNLIAFGFFGEKLNPAQMGGVALGMVAMVLMLWPNTGSA
ncbi:MAG: eamA-like transporter family protein [Rhizobium sp.]|nr:eamA-like transporter family protein [Rhizobium sp.]